MGIVLEPGSQHVVYTYVRERGAVELFRASLLGDSGPMWLSGPMAGAGVLDFGRRFAISPDGRRVVYIADQDEAGKLELFATAQIPLVGRTDL